MSYLLNNQQRFNDVVFEHRNKSYGAYAIRSSYGNTLFRSLALVTFGCGALIISGVYLSRSGMDHTGDLTEQSKPPVIYETPVSLTPEEPAPAEAPKSKPDPGKPAASALSTNIADSAAVETASQSLNDQIVSTTTASSTATGSGIEIPGGGGGTGGTVIAPEPKTPLSDIEVDSGPEFEGGVGALLRFVSGRLRYPQVAADEGREGTVYVRFVVDENGKVSDVLLRNNLGYGLDEEARRVVSMIPDFKSPAKVHGQAVKVYFHLPIKFKLR